MRARYYNTDIRRFINQDIITGSIGNSQSLNRYAYVQGNPVNYNDPFGLSPRQILAPYAAVAHDILNIKTIRFLFKNIQISLIGIIVPCLAKDVIGILFSDFKPFILLCMKGFFMSVSILVTPECMMGAEGLNSGRIPV